MLGIGMAACGVAGTLAWAAGMWGSLAAALLCGVWLAGALWMQAARGPPPLAARAGPAAGESEGEEEARAVMYRLLLDAVPTPLVAIEEGSARAVNGAARRLFGTDTRILPLPPALADSQARLLVHEGRRWRIDRVDAARDAPPFAVAALVDVESESSLAEARAGAELIEILGHELLNGLSPIVSLAESAQEAVRGGAVDSALLEEILGPLLRRAESLERFAEAYRQLARLPAPELRNWHVAQILRDLAAGFTRRWPGVAFTAEAGDVPDWPLDRDQLYQALWALLANAAEAVEGRPEARVWMACGLRGAALAFEVGDTGPGVAPAIAAQIFRPFHTTKPGGSGIGLSLARQIARGHGGTLELAGADPTLFRLVLPLRAADGGAAFKAPGRQGAAAE
jgi:signal transduction histidine kinase